MKKNLTEIVFILDRSGSMSGLEADTIGGFNSMLEKQKKDYEENFLSQCRILSDEREVCTEENGIRMTVKYKLERNIGVKQPITVLY